MSNFFDATEWQIVNFGDIAELVNESVKNPFNEGIERYVGLEDLTPQNLTISSWGNISDGTTFTRRFRKGDVLFGRRRSYQKKAALADFDGLCSGDILVFRAKQNKLLPELLPFIVQMISSLNMQLKLQLDRSLQELNLKI